MNKAELIGRITKDLDVKTSQAGNSYLNFSIAVDRRFKDNQGNKQTDFLDCKAFGKTADFIGQYFGKGDKIGIIGPIQTDKWQDQNGNNRVSVYILVDEAEFVESKKAAQPTIASTAPTAPKVQASMDFFSEMAQAVSGDDDGSSGSAAGGTLPFEI